MSDPERCYPDGKVIREGEMIDGWCHQCGHLKLAHHISGQCAPCQIVVESQYRCECATGGDCNVPHTHGAIRSRCCDEHHYSCALGEDGPAVRCCPNCAFGKTS